MSEGKIWWITGATSGIGAALADASAQAGVKVILSGRNLSALTAIPERCSPGALVLPFEATDFENISSLVDRAWEWAVSQGGSINGLFNNAGISQRSLAIETVFEVYQRIIDVDLLAPIALTQALLPRMVRAGGGDIVAISSVAGIAGVPLRSAYSAAKEPQVAARRILDAITAGQRELILAEGMEAEIAKLRRSDPNALFDQMARLVADGYAKKMGA